MSMRKQLCKCAVALIIAHMPGVSLADEHPRLGVVASVEDIANVDLAINRDGAGLPPGRGSVAEGAIIYQARCAYCHGSDGQARGLEIVGGIGSLASEVPVKTVGSYWPYAATLFDYTRRSMPYDAPQSLSNNEVYSVVAYMLALNNIIDEEKVVSDETLAGIQMPNRDGFRYDDELE